MRYDLVDLKLFLHVLETQSITGGAGRSHLSLASASARIKGMEEMLGTPLLERHHRGVTPTPAGRALAHHAQAMMHQLELMNSEMSNYASGLRPRIRLLCNTAALTEHLPDILSSFLLKHTNTDLDVEERPSHQIVESINRRHTELGVLANNTELYGLETRRFRTDNLVAIAALHLSPFASRISVSFEELLHETFVGLASNNALQKHLEEKAKQAGRRLSFRVRVASLDTVCDLVSHGVGIAIIPEITYRRSRYKDALRMSKLENLWAARSLYLCAYRFDTLTPQVTALVEHILGKPDSYLLTRE